MESNKGSDLVYFGQLSIGQKYTRDELADLWGYARRQAISRGVVTPLGTNIIILFVTKLKQESDTQYNDYIDGKYLYWEGEKGHGNDRRIVSSVSKDDIYLFFRDRHHTPFVYYGKVFLSDFTLYDDKPSEFVLTIGSELDGDTLFDDLNQIKFENRSMKQTDVDQFVKCRLGQGKFRKDLIKLWGECSVTGLPLLGVLKASHIKPWKYSSNSERLDPFNGLLLAPNLDALFDSGYISFSEDGKIIISEHLGHENINLLGINSDMMLRYVYPQNRLYLLYHRENVFIG
jgi:putative restriction endonuclease